MAKDPDDVINIREPKNPHARQRLGPAEDGWKEKRRAEMIANGAPAAEVDRLLDDVEAERARLEGLDRLLNPPRQKFTAAAVRAKGRRA